MTHDELFERITRLLQACPYSVDELVSTLETQPQPVLAALSRLVREGKICQTARTRRGGPFFTLSRTPSLACDFPHPAGGRPPWSPVLPSEDIYETTE
jgi:hypothetical protein